jgi:hypothetical protein
MNNTTGNGGIAPPPPLPSPSSIVDANTTAAKIRDYFRIIDGTTDAALMPRIGVVESPPPPPGGE